MDCYNHYGSKDNCYRWTCLVKTSFLAVRLAALQRSVNLRMKGVSPTSRDVCKFATLRERDGSQAPKDDKLPKPSIKQRCCWTLLTSQVRKYQCLDNKSYFCSTEWKCSFYHLKQQKKNIQRNLQSNDANKLAKLYFFSYPWQCYFSIHS